MNAFDVIIAGCGPAGATAGFILARQGLSTAMIDQHCFPRPKLCGGLLPLKTTELLHRVFEERIDTLAEKGIINYTSHGYQIYLLKDLLVNKTTDLPFSFVDRSDYDQFLLEKARSQGVALFQDERVTAVDPVEGDLWTSSGRRFKARFIIGADGINSVVRRCFPEDKVKRKTWSANKAAALEVYIPRSCLQWNIDQPQVHLGYVDWGYAWVFPNRDRIIVGIGGLSRKNHKNINQLFRDFMAGLNFTAPADSDGELKLHGHPIPYGNMLTRTVHRNVVLTGDAAGLADPITGEGIYYAHRSAEMAALSILRTVKTGAPLEETCLKLMQRHVFPELRRAKLLRILVFGALKRLPAAMTKRLVLWGDRKALHVIHGLRGYTLKARVKGGRHEDCP
ncbi:MAG TPA: geranylgeranyl reductase family protein [Desulfomonilia bacterium]|nr:geranylgeranyl reductase family protein [Desulfomonilia bacterium]